VRAHDVRSVLRAVELGRQVHGPNLSDAPLPRGCRVNAPSG
jgi:hypothetical protein